jgi:hypothetical protein
VYVWHAGYWAPHVGFYGGIDYGFGYFGHGYDGGFWNHGRLFYNRAVNNIGSAHITNVYDRAVVNDRTVNHISFNGGRGGVNARPTQAEQAATREPHIQPTVFQTRHMNTARSNRNLLASSNGGQPRFVKSNFSGQHANAGNLARAADGRRGYTPARMSLARPGPRANTVNAGERREGPQRGGGQKPERGRRE